MSDSSAATHAVFNQVPDLSGYNLFETDPACGAALERLGGGWHAGALEAFGARLEAEVQAWAADANRLTPELHTHSRTGARIDAVSFHPSWHALLGLLRGQQLQALPFAQPRAGAWAARTAGYFLQAQVESGSLCPTTMTLASIPVLRKEPARCSATSNPGSAATRPRRPRPALARQDRRADRHGHDREAGRLRRARQHHRRPAGASARAGAPNTR